VVTVLPARTAAPISIIMVAASRNTSVIASEGGMVTNGKAKPFGYNSARRYTTTEVSRKPMAMVKIVTHIKICLIEKCVAIRELFKHSKLRNSKISNFRLKAELKTMKLL
jgi:hypothetical protein